MVKKIRYVKRDTRVSAIKKLKIMCSFCNKVYCIGWINTKPICSKCRDRLHTKPKRVYRTNAEKKADG